MDTDEKLGIMFGVVAGIYYGFGGFRLMVIGTGVCVFTFALGFLSARLYRNLSVDSHEKRSEK